MTGGNVSHLFQDPPPEEEKCTNAMPVKKGVWNGPDRRDEVRGPVSKESQIIINAIRASFGNCKKNCVIPQEAQSIIAPALQLLYKAGNGDLFAGLRAFEEFFREGSSLFKTMNETKKRVWYVVVTAVAFFLMGTFGIGIITKISRWLNEVGG